MKYKALVLLFLLITSCNFKEPKQFTEAALQDVFITADNKEITFQKIINKHKGKKILLSIWASWCPDCLEALPQEKELQKEFNNTVFIHLSLDKNYNSWKEGLERLNIKGEHYLMQSGWKGDFGKFLNLGWIPRYLIINKKGEIAMYKATKPTSKLIKKSLKK